MARQKRYWIIGGGILAATLAVGGGIAAGGGLDDDDEPLTGETYTKAVAAALKHTGGGTVTETEVGDDGAAYDVEVRLADGSEVEVQLDSNFKVIGTENEDGDEGEEGDDD